MEIGTLTKLKLKVTVVTFGKTPGRKIARLIAPPPPSPHFLQDLPFLECPYPSSIVPSLLSWDSNYAQ